jgi:carboxypeptidase family protein/TonB-dependent receptor-like protein
MLKKRFLVYGLMAVFAFSSLQGVALAQVSTSRISGTVLDAQGAAVSNADVVVKNDQTGAEFKTKTSEDGTFVVPALPVSNFTVTASASGFKQTAVTNVKTIAGETVNVEVRLEAGAPSEIITVASGAEVLQKETTAVGSTITGRQITDLPFTSRDALDLVMNLPGTTTPGRPRSSSVNGLPQGSLNITLDGVNVQDNLIRSGDGFFTFIRPRIDAIEEVNVTTANPGSESAGEGAVQVKFVTKGGTNEYHGGAWWQNRQPNLNANYYFNNLAGLPRDPIRLDQYGFKIGGPVTPWLKDKVFFFFAYDRFRLPESLSRQRVILSPDAEAGIYRYRRTDGSVQAVNLLQLAASRGFTGTRDPIIGGTIDDIRASTASGTVAANPTDLNRQQFSFVNIGGQDRYFPTLRLDWNATSKHHVETIWNYQDFNNGVDFLNGNDPAFPEPVGRIAGGQNSNRWSLVTALRSQLSSSVVNEARFGLVGGISVFSGEINPGVYAPFGGVALGFNNAGLTDPWPNPFGRAGSWRNTPVKQFSDNLSWNRGTHSLNFGGNYTYITSWQNGPNGVPIVNFGVLADDPASALFSTANFPGATPAILNDAAAIYALLTGRVTSIAGLGASLEESTRQYSLEGNLTTRDRSREFGVYMQDFWKARPNLTINYGLRYEYQYPLEHRNGVYTRPGFAALFGESGPGNLFNPGVQRGSPSPTPFVQVTGDTELYSPDKNNLAPSIGFAWTPEIKGGLFGRLLGEGKTVLRGGYSISYNRESISFLSQLIGANPGPIIALGATAGSSFEPGSLLFRQGLPAIQVPSAPTYPVAFNPAAGDAIVDFDPNIKVPYVQSWSFGIQRELSRDTVFEARYVGNHALGIWRRYSPNEVNIFENGFLQEFMNAQRNLQIARTANPASNNFNNTGLAGQVSLPIMLASFGSATSANFSSATLANLLVQGQAGNFANVLARSTAFQARRVAAGLPANLFVAFPGAINGVAVNNNILVTNGGSSTYNGLQLELRRRLTNGLLVQGSYTFSKSLTDQFFALSNQNGNNQPRTLRDLAQDKGISPFDIRHSFKVNYIYELPIGPGRAFDYNGPARNIVSRIIGGWETHGIVRWQSGRPFLLTSGRATVNQFESGVVLVGMDAKELQDAVGIIKPPDAGVSAAGAGLGFVYFLPDDIRENTLKAFGLIPGTPTGRYIAPPTTPGQFGGRIFLRQPSFFRADLSAVKRLQIRESMNLELRAEFLNAFNNINFFVGSPATVSVNHAVNAAFGTTNQAYRDLSTTNDPGGRLLQLVARFNF